MDQSHVYIVAGLVAVAMPITLLFAFRKPAQFEQLMARLTLWYNIFVLVVAVCLAGGAVYFAIGMFTAPKHDMFFWVYMTGACLFGLFAFLNFATRHKRGSRDGSMIALFTETARLWRERFGSQAKAWKDVGRN